LGKGIGNIEIGLKEIKIAKERGGKACFTDQFSKFMACKFVA